jgi:lipid-A-disaccharide synthase
LRRAGVRTVHFVSPSIWAWRGERIARIRKAVDRMLTLFPFELPIYQRAGIPASFVGHPFAAAAPEHRDPLRMRAFLKLDPARPVIALLPGSRVSELEAHAEIFLRTAELLCARVRSPQFVVPLASRETRSVFEQTLRDLGLSELPLSTVFGHAERALEAADVALVASGTATLEAMLYQCPHVITYRVHPLTAWIVRRKLASRFVGMPNVIAGRFVVPEILQDDAQPETLAQALANLLADFDLRLRLESLFASLSQSLRVDTDAALQRAIGDELQAAGVELSVAAEAAC